MTASTLPTSAADTSDSPSSAAAGANPFGFGAMGTSDNTDHKSGEGAEASRMASAGESSIVELCPLRLPALVSCREMRSMAHFRASGSSPF